MLKNPSCNYLSPEPCSPCCAVREATAVRSPHTTKKSPRSPQLEKAHVQQQRPSRAPQTKEIHLFFFSEKVLKELSEWKDIPRIGRVTTIRQAIVPKLIYRFYAVSVNIPSGYFAGSDKLILKFIWKHKNQAQPKQSIKNKAGGLTSWFESFLQSHSMQNTVVLAQHGRTAQWGQRLGSELAHTGPWFSTALDCGGRLSAGRPSRARWWACTYKSMKLNF